MNISNENIWVTGGSSGIGRELACMFADMGNYVIISGRDKNKLEDTRSHDRKRITSLVCDVSNSDSMKAAAEELQNLTDSLDRVIFSAGICEYVDNVSQLDPALFRRVFDANFFWVVNFVEVAIPFLKKAQKRGHIVGISSLSSVVPFPRAEAYGASKAALYYFLESLRMDVHQHNIDVTLVSPGFVDTPLTARNDFSMPFLMDAKQAASIIIKGMIARKKHIVFPKRLGWLLEMGNLFPGLWFRLMLNRMSERSGI